MILTPWIARSGGPTPHRPDIAWPTLAPVRNGAPGMSEIQEMQDVEK
jgi:hypothetical protein